MFRHHSSCSPKEAAAATPASVGIDAKMVQESGKETISPGAAGIARTTTWATGIFDSHAYLEENRRQSSL
jgi:hypothetical protein